MTGPPHVFHILVSTVLVLEELFLFNSSVTTRVTVFSVSRETIYVMSTPLRHSSTILCIYALAFEKQLFTFLFIITQLNEEFDYMSDCEYEIVLERYKVCLFACVPYERRVVLTKYKSPSCTIQ